MPELPEAEVVRRGLLTYLPNSTLSQGEVLHPRVARRTQGGSELLARNLEGLHISSIERRGKFLWMVTDTPSEPTAIVIHLGMSGQIHIQPHASGHHHCRLRAQLSSGNIVEFIDQRTFGYWAITTLQPDRQSQSNRLIPELALHLAPDLLEEAFTMDDVIRRMRRRRVPMKSALLDQELISGIGNIYSDEALWAAGIHGARLASGLSYEQLRTIVQEAQAVIRRALQVGGTSFDTLYVNVAGEPGYFARSLNAYGKAGKPCPRCHTVLTTVVVGGRSHTFCPSCQKIPSRIR